MTTPGYVFTHEGTHYAPDGKAPGVSDPQAHNKALEAAQLEAWASKPSHEVAYVDDARKVGQRGLVVTTWLGTVMGSVIHCRDCRDGLGHNMRSIRVMGTNGARYYGRYGHDWGQAVRLRLMGGHKG